VATGGNGGLQNQPGCTPPGGCPILDTQDELALTKDGHLLFAVNAGSNTISALRVTKHSLKLVGTPTSSGGVFPNSLAVHGNVLYALNSNSDNIAGFRFSHTGHLKSIAASSQPLVGGAIPGLPRDIAFDNSGRVLVVTLLANTGGPPPVGGTSNTIDTFVVKKGVAGPGTAHDSTTDFPFAVAFTPRNQAFVAQVDQLTGPPGTVQGYNVSHSGAVSPIGTGASSNGNAPCWIRITSNGRYAYVVNTGGGAPGGANVAEYKLSPSGKLTLLGNTTADPTEFANTDEMLSRGDKYLYVLVPLYGAGGSAPDGMSRIDEYKVGHNGTLTRFGSTTPTADPGVSGLVGR